MSVAPFTIVVGGGSVPVIAHVPHSTAEIPADARAQFLLSDDELQREIVRLTDWHTDRLFSSVTSLGGSMFINTVSRLIFDPERFVDDADEPMAAVGQGVVYTRSTQGELLRDLTELDREGLIRGLYEPYHEGFSAAVNSCLDSHGMCLILDCHSFATVPLPSEPSQAVPRPDVCIGTDSFHTPRALADALGDAFSAEGFVVASDTPFSGTMVPLEHYQQDARVRSVMIEVRRGLYCDESTGEPNAEFERVRAAIERALTYAVGVALAEAGE